MLSPLSLLVTVGYLWHIAQTIPFFSSLHTNRGIPFSTDDGRNFRIRPSSYNLTFSLPCFCSVGRFRFLFTTDFPRVKQTQTDIVYRLAVKRSKVISFYLRGFQVNCVEMQVSCSSASSAFKMRGDNLYANHSYDVDRTGHSTYLLPLLISYALTIVQFVFHFHSYTTSDNLVFVYYGQASSPAI